jgi:cephalosporin hydroxylase
VEDSNVNGHPVLREFGEAPMEAILEYEQRHPHDCYPDSTREAKYGLTLAHYGSLARR